MSRVSEEVIEQLFTKAQTAHGFDESKPVSNELLKELYDLTKFPPTCFNMSPLRIVFVKSAESKADVVECLYPGNQEKTSKAPVVAILAADHDFVETLPFLCPAYDAKSLFLANPDWIPHQATLNANLSAGYFITAARSLGLQVGPMTGVMFDKISEKFFADKPNQKPFIVINLGYGTTPSTYYPRAPRLEFDEVAKIL